MDVYHAWSGQLTLPFSEEMLFSIVNFQAINSQVCSETSRENIKKTAKKYGSCNS